MIGLAFDFEVLKMISVIMPAFNSEKYILSSINSVLKYPYNDIELIVVDDFSTDSTKNIVKSFSDKRVRYSLNKFSKGPNGCIETALSISKGNIITFLDSDDLIDWNVFYIYKKSFSNQMIDLVCVNFSFFYKNCVVKNKERLSEGIYSQETIFGKVLPINDYPSIDPCRWAKAFRKEKLLNAFKMVDDTLIIGDDQSLLFNYLPLCQNVKIINKSFILYRQRATSIMHNTSIVFMADYDKMIDSLNYLDIEKENLRWYYFMVTIRRIKESKESVDAKRKELSALRKYFKKRPILFFPNTKSKILYFILKFKFYFVILRFGKKPKKQTLFP